MAALSRYVRLETDEGEPTMLSEQPSKSHQLRVQARPRRQNGVPLRTVLALVATMLFLAAITTCFHLSRKAVRTRHEHAGRRLAAGQHGGEEEDKDNLLSEILDDCLDMEAELESSPDQVEEDDHLLSRILSDCLEMQEELYMPLSQSPLPEEKQAVSRTLFSIYQLQQVVNQLQPKAGPLPSSEDSNTLFPSQLQIGLSSSPPEALQSTVAQMPSTSLSAGASAPPGWYFQTEASPQVSITSPPAQPPPKAKTKRKWSLSTTAFGEEPALKKQIKTSAQSQFVAEKITSGVKMHDDPAAANIFGQQDGPPQPPAAGFISPSAKAQGAESRPCGFFAVSTPHKPAMTVLHAPLQPVPIVPVTGVVSSAADAAAAQQAAAVFPLPGPAFPMMPETHLYYRLPTVEPGNISRAFNTVRAFSTIGCPSAHPHLSSIHNLLTRLSITPGQAEVLISACEDLVTYLWRFHRTPADGRRASNAANILARRFLCLEAIFTVIQVIGPAMRAELWWSMLLSAIPTEVHYSTPIRRQQIIECVRLAQRLSSALASLKRGIRPTPDETIAIKRMLFKQASIRLGFAEPRWDAWRKDDPDEPPATST
ncbi:hypothetical protein Emag_007066 [Eimeria magna]